MRKFNVGQVVTIKELFYDNGPECTDIDINLTNKYKNGLYVITGILDNFRERYPITIHDLMGELDSLQVAPNEIVLVNNKVTSSIKPSSNIFTAINNNYAYNQL